MISRQSYPEIFLLSGLVDSIASAGHRRKHSLANIIEFLIVLNLLRSHYVLLSAQLALLQQLPQKDHHLSVVQLIHGDQQNCTLDYAEVLNKEQVTWMYLLLA